MQIDSMLSDSIELMVLGMGTVFLILLLLIGCLSLMSFLMSTPVEAPTSTEAAESKEVRSNVTTPVGVVAAIQAAIHSYRASPNS